MTILLGCTSALSAHASGRTKPTVNSFRPDCKESMIVSTTLNASRSRAILGSVKPVDRRATGVDQGGISGASQLE